LRHAHEDTGDANMSNDPYKGPPGLHMVDGWAVANGDFPADPLERLVYYARMAPSRHNTQPWKFLIRATEIDVFADETRWLRVADPLRRELHISIGCAVESLRIAADFAQYGTQVHYFPVEHDQTLAVRVVIALDGPKRELPAAGLLQHMITRHTSRRKFDPAKAVTDADRMALYRCFETGDVSLHFVSGRPALDALAALELRADTLLLSNPEYREELSHWFGQGYLDGSWLTSALGRLAVGHLPVTARIAHEDAERVASAPLVAVLSTRRDWAQDRVQAGEAYMRVALVAESRGIRIQPMSQILELEETRAALCAPFELGDRVAQHVFRLGHAQAETRAHARRPAEEVILRPETAG